MIELNKCYCEDNINIMKKIDDNSIDLIYCDILYNTGKKFKDYDDKLGTPQEAIEWYKPRLIEMKRILKNTGSIYLQCDYRLVHYLKVEMDNIFGINNYINSVIWNRVVKSISKSKRFNNSYDEILIFSKTNKYIFNEQYTINNEYINKFKHKDENGKYNLVPLIADGMRNGDTGEEWENINPSLLGKNGRHWITKRTNLDKLKCENKIIKSESGIPYKKYYLYEAKGLKVNNVWNDIIPIMKPVYDTEKPKALLERIIKASSNEGDIIADFFCGSGTTGVIAKELNRKYILCDINPRAIEISGKRLNEVIK